MLSAFLSGDGPVWRWAAATRTSASAPPRRYRSAAAVAGARCSPPRWAAGDCLWCFILSALSIGGASPPLLRPCLCMGVRARRVCSPPAATHRQRPLSWTRWRGREAALRAETVLGVTETRFPRPICGLCVANVARSATLTVGGGCRRQPPAGAARTYLPPRRFCLMAPGRWLWWRAQRPGAAARRAGGCRPTSVPTTRGGMAHAACRQWWRQTRSASDGPHCGWQRPVRGGSDGGGTAGGAGSDADEGRPCPFCLLGVYRLSLWPPWRPLQVPSWRRSTDKGVDPLAGWLVSGPSRDGWTTVMVGPPTLCWFAPYVGHGRCSPPFSP